MINSFSNHYDFLSNFYPSEIEWGGLKYPTVEHYFQAFKTLDFDERAEIAAAATPGLAKRLGREVQLRDDWEEIKDMVMEIGLRKKFEDPQLRARLRATGRTYLEEGNSWHDNYWGNCYCSRCQQVRGRNHLGQLLMKIRDEEEE